jgi:chromosome segregation ATPase
MSGNESDCGAIEQRINRHDLYISTTRDQINKLDLQDPDVQNKRDALHRKLDSLQEQLGDLHHALEDCRQGKGANFPPFDIVSDDNAGGR